MQHVVRHACMSAHLQAAAVWRQVPFFQLALICCFSLLSLALSAVYNLDEADVEGQRKRFDLYDEAGAAACAAAALSV